MMGPKEREAVVREIARVVESEGELNGLEVDTIDLVDGRILVELEDGTQFTVSVEGV